MTDPCRADAGAMVVQLARAAGAEVIGTASAANQAALIRGSHRRRRATHRQVGHLTGVRLDLDQAQLAGATLAQQ